MKIDRQLLTEAMAATGHTTGRATVEAALRRTIRLRAQAAAIERMKGIGWSDDPEEAQNRVATD